MAVPDENTNTFKHFCRECREYKRASHLLLLDVEDWCGALDAICLPCGLSTGRFALTEREFRKAAAAQWKERALRMGWKYRTYARNTWKMIKTLLEAKCPGQSSRGYRYMMEMYLKTWALVMISDLTKDQETKMAAIAVQEKYVAELQQQALDATYVPRHGGWTLCSEDAQHLIRLTENIICSFICEDCGWYGSDWIQSAISFHFRCPSCGKFYQPWAGGRPYNKLVVIRHPVRGTFLYLPMLWPATNEDNWLMSMAEMYARQVHLPENLNAFVERQAVDLSELIEAAGVPAHFEHQTLGLGAEWKMSPPQFPPETYARHKTVGYYGAHFRPTEPVQVFQDTDRLVALVGNMLAAHGEFKRQSAL